MNRIYHSTDSTTDQQPATTPALDLQPALPPDFDQRMVWIYRLAIQRYQEHHNAQAAATTRQDGDDHGTVTA